MRRTAGWEGESLVMVTEIIIASGFRAGAARPASCFIKEEAEGWRG